MSEEQLPRLTLKLKEFLVSLFSEELDAEFMASLVRIGRMHRGVAVPARAVFFGFYAINRVLAEIASNEKRLSPYLPLCLKLLSLCEFVINDTFYKESLSRTETETAPHKREIDVLLMLHLGLSVHKQNTAGVERFLRTGDRSRVEGLVLDYRQCPLQKMLDGLAWEEYKTPALFNIDVEELSANHRKWHDCLRSALETPGPAEAGAARERLLPDFHEAFEVMKKNMERPLSLGISIYFLVMDSSINVMRELLNSLNENMENADLAEVFSSRVEHNVLYYFTWAIEEYAVADAPREDVSGYDVSKSVLVYNKPVYVYIKLKDIPARSYVLDLSLLGIEILSLVIAHNQRKQELADFADKAAAAGRAKDMFLAGMSHELRTPLNAIIGFSQILSQKSDTPDGVRQHIEKINISGKNLLQLIDTILDFAKLESGKMAFSPEPSDMERLILETMDMVQGLSQGKGIVLKGPENRPPALRVDAGLIKEVFSNLLSNAVKFTPEKGTISISYAFLPDEKAHRFSVADAGTGIRHEDMARLFQPFVQLENPFRKSSRGTGLGLVISRKIVEMHGGRIWVESEYGKGATFHFTIPA